jgi:hypothetical protein
MIFFVFIFMKLSHFHDLNRGCGWLIRIDLGLFDFFKLNIFLILSFNIGLSRELDFIIFHVFPSIRLFCSYNLRFSGLAQLC